MCGSMADIQSATAEIRRGKKEYRKKETTGQKYNGYLNFQGSGTYLTNIAQSFTHFLILHPQFSQSQADEILVK